MFTLYQLYILYHTIPQWYADKKGSQLMANKRRIIDTLEPVMNQHRLIVSSEVVRKDVDFLFENPEQNQKYSLLYQMTRICPEKGALKHDDRIDALHLTVWYHLEAMSRDTNQALKESRSRAMDQELAKFMASVTGNGFSVNPCFTSRFGR